MHSQGLTLCSSSWVTSAAAVTSWGASPSPAAATAASEAAAGGCSGDGAASEPGAASVEPEDGFLDAGEVHRVATGDGDVHRRECRAVGAAAAARGAVTAAHDIDAGLRAENKAERDTALPKRAIVGCMATAGR